jgi:hypothetical protein
MGSGSRHALCSKADVLAWVVVVVVVVIVLVLVWWCWQVLALCWFYGRQASVGLGTRRQNKPYPSTQTPNSTLTPYPMNFNQPSHNDSTRFTADYQSTCCKVRLARYSQHIDKCGG